MGKSEVQFFTPPHHGGCRRKFYARGQLGMGFRGGEGSTRGEEYKGVQALRETVIIPGAGDSVTCCRNTNVIDIHRWPLVVLCNILRGATLSKSALTVGAISYMFKAGIEKIFASPGKGITGT